MYRLAIRFLVSFCVILPLSVAQAETTSERIEAYFTEINATSEDVRILAALYNQLLPLSTDGHPGYKHVGDWESFRFGTYQELWYRIWANTSHSPIWNNLALRLADEKSRIAATTILRELTTLNQSQGGISGGGNYWINQREALIRGVKKAAEGINSLIKTYAETKKPAIDALSFVLSTLDPEKLSEDMKARLNELQAGVKALETQINESRGSLTDLENTIKEKKAEQAQVEASIQALLSKVKETEAKLAELTKAGASGVITVNIAKSNPGWSAEYQDAFSQALNDILKKKVEDLLIVVGSEMPNSDRPNVAVSVVYDDIRKSRRFGFLWTKGFKATARITFELTYGQQQRFVRAEVPIKSSGEVRKSVIGEVDSQLSGTVKGDLILMAKKQAELCPVGLVAKGHDEGSRH